MDWEILQLLILPQRYDSPSQPWLFIYKERGLLTASGQAGHTAGPGKVDSSRQVARTPARSAAFVVERGTPRGEGDTALHVPRQRPAHFGPCPPRPRPSRIALSPKPRPSHIRQSHPALGAPPRPLLSTLSSKPRPLRPGRALTTRPPRFRPALRRPRLSSSAGAGGGAPRLLCQVWAAARALPSVSTRGLTLPARPLASPSAASQPPAPARGPRPQSRAGARSPGRRNPGDARPLPSTPLLPAACAHGGPGTRPPRWQGPGPSCQAPPPQPVPAASGPDGSPEKMSPRCPPQPSETRSRRARGRLPR